jgi:hypothetical protein
MKTTHLLSAIVLAPILAMAADAPFFTFNISGPLGKGGAQVSMKFEEIDRTDANSVVEVSGVAPNSDLSTGFLLNGMCGLATARGQRYFQAKQIDTDPVTFEVVFPKTAPNSASVPLNGIAPNVFPVSQCTAPMKYVPAPKK